MSVDEKVKMFSYCCEIHDLLNNFGKSDGCEFNCKELLSNDNLLNCAYLNKASGTLGHLNH